jgi:flagellar biosynthesis/type III secretory pathway M-ring protein FliF/YscJ
MTMAIVIVLVVVVVVGAIVGFTMARRRRDNPSARRELRELRKASRTSDGDKTNPHRNDLNPGDPGVGF